jgi:isopentenyl diphosphate isomerase/L-lactate dehydrogenase-like FMN-dependent dehydrogenase
MTTSLNIEDLRRQAKRRLPKPIFDFMDGGAEDEVTLRANRDDFAKLTFNPRTLVDMSQRRMSARVLGQDFNLPFLLAPTGLTGAFWPHGEILAASAAKEAGIGYCLSTNATTSIEEIAKHFPGFWFQLYALRDREVMHRLIARAKAAGASVLILTVDLAAHGRRERDVRTGFTVPPKLTPANVMQYASRPGWLWRLVNNPGLTFANFGDLTERGLGLVSLGQYVSTQFDPAINWQDLTWIRDLWGGKLALKGILAPEDARTAVAHGIDAIIVSNHGGRQLDSAASAIAALPAIADAVGDRAEVLIDSGIRRGSDIVKALALGATACLIGRAFLYGLATGGQAGVSRAIDILRSEIDNVQALLGCPDLARIDRSFLKEPGRPGLGNR